MDSLEEWTLLHHHVVDWLRDIEPKLLHINKQQPKFVRPQRMTFCATLLQICARIDESMRPACIELREHRDIIRAMCRRIPKTTQVPIDGSVL